MANEGDGRLYPYVRTIRTQSTPTEAAKVRHHLELLIDANHAHRVSRSEVRITNAGYDFLAAVEKDEKFKKMFHEYFGAGATYLDAAIRVVNAVRETLPNPSA